MHKAYLNLVSSILKRPNRLWLEPLRSILYRKPFTSKNTPQNKRIETKLYLKPRSVVKETQIRQALKLYISHCIKAIVVLKFSLAPDFPANTRSSEYHFLYVPPNNVQGICARKYCNRGRNIRKIRFFGLYYLTGFFSCPTARCVKAFDKDWRFLYDMAMKTHIKDNCRSSVDSLSTPSTTWWCVTRNTKRWTFSDWMEHFKHG